MAEINFDAAPHWKATLQHIGTENNSVLLIDNFFSTPDILVQHACTKSFVRNAPYYPGIRAAVPAPYLRELRQPLSQVLVEVFDYGQGVSLQECYYSLVTTPGEDLNTVQSLPHIDGGDDNKVALLHYLCDEAQGHGGTAFYRQRRTSFESVPNDKFPAYKAALEADVAEFGMPEAGYYFESDEKFERIAYIPAKYNRAIAYRGVNLHAVHIGPDFQFSANPAKGRLTVNTFLNPLSG